MPTSASINFENLYITHFEPMKRFARTFVNDAADVENIVQDVFVELWEKRELLEMSVNVDAFLFTAVKNRCIDYLRRRIAEAKALEHIQEEYMLYLKISFDSLEAFSQNVLTDEDIDTLIDRAIATLPERCRTIFVKKRFDGMKYKDIAAELGVTVNTVESQMAIAYKKLREELKDYLP